MVVEVDQGSHRTGEVLDAWFDGSNCVGTVPLHLKRVDAITKLKPLVHAALKPDEIYTDGL